MLNRPGKGIQVQQPTPAPTYNFGQTSASYATIPDWTPNGFPFTVSLETDDGLASTVQFVIDGPSANTGMASFLGSASMSFSIDADTDTINLSAASDFTAPLKWESTTEPDRVSAAVNYVEDNDNLGSMDLPTYTTIGAKDDTTVPFEGVIKNVALTDLSPIQGRKYQVLNRTFHADLNKSITIDLEKTFSIDFDWVHTTVVDDRILANGNGDNAFAIRLRSDGRLQFSTATTTTSLNGVLSGLANGQHCHICLRGDGSRFYAEVDGVAIDDQAIPAQAAVSSIGSIGAKHNDTDSAAGAMANLEIVCSSDDGLRSFPAYGSGHADIVDEFSGTSSSDMGDSFNTPVGDPLDYSSDGFVRTTGIGAVGWDITTGAYIPLQTEGYTCQYYMEKSVFAELYAGSDLSTLFLVDADNQGFIINKAADNIDSATNLNVVAGDGFKTVDTGYDESHVQCTFVWDPAGGGVDGVYRFYANGHLLKEADKASTTVPTMLFITGNNFLSYPAAESIKNVTLFRGPLDATSNSVTMVVLGDSYTTWGQYQSGNLDNLASPTADADNNPALVGYDGTGLSGTSAPYDYKNGSLFANLHGELATKGRTCAEIDYAGRSLASVVTSFPDASYLFSERVDAALGEAGSYPPGTGDYDYWVVNIGSNDVAINYAIGFEASWTAIVVALITELKIQIARMVDDGGAELVILCSVMPRMSNNERTHEMTAELNAAYATLEGYLEVVKYVDCENGWGPWSTDDGTHPNTVGQRMWAKAVGCAIPAMPTTSTYTYPMVRDSSDFLFLENTNADTGMAFHGVWTADNWTDIPNNSRFYAINDDTSEIRDALDGGFGLNHGTIVNYDASDWSVGGVAVDFLTTDGGDFLTTDSGDFLITHTP